MRYFALIMSNEAFASLDSATQNLLTTQAEYPYASDNAFSIKVSEQNLKAIKNAFPQYDPKSAFQRYYTCLISET